MRRAGQLFFCCLLLLANLSRSAIPAESKDEPIESLTNLAVRRQKLTEAIAEREQAQLAGDQVTVIKLSNRIVELYLKLYEFDSALTQSQTSLATARAIAGSGDTKLLVDTFIISGRVYITRTQSTNALPLLKKALDLSANQAYRQGEAQSYAQLAGAYFDLGQLEEAQASNDQALRISQELQDKRIEAFATMTQGYLLMRNDRPAEALVAFKNAENIWRSLNDRAELANALVDQNLLAIRQGQWQEALKSLNEAQELLVDKEAEPYLAGKIANSFGEIYEVYGRLDTALSYFQEALNYFRDGAHDIQGTVTASYKVARVQARLGNFDEAKQQIAQSLAAAQETKNNLTIGLCHENLGNVWLAENSYDSARLEFLTAISYYTKSKEERPLARAQLYLGQTEYLLGDLAGAGAAYQKALHFFTNTSDYTNEAALRFGLGKLALQQGQVDKAEEHLSRSIKLTELLRENASSRELRSSFLDSIHDRYETYVEWLMTRYERDRSQQNAIKAFEAAEAGRARSLLDSLYSYGRELLQPSDTLLLLEEEKLQKHEQELVDQRTALLSHGGTEKEKAGVEQKLREVRGELEALEARINSSAKVKDLRPAPLSYEQIQADITDAKTSLVSYSLGDAKSFAWVVTKDGLDTYELSSKKSIEEAANRLINLINTPPVNESEQTKLQTAIDDVSRLVVEPVSSKLQTSRLIVVADGVLQYVPFQILKTSAAAPEQMISRFDIVDAPSASALAIVRRERQRRQPGPKLLIGFGDAVFSPDYAPGATQAGTNSSEGRSKGSSRFADLPPLFNAKRELRAIGELAGSDSTFYEEYNATRAQFLNVDLSQFRILHVVTHGVLDDKQPELSGLVLSLVDGNARPIDGFVSLADVYKLRAPVDLVVLSACHTALGQKLRGEGLIGLTRGFMYAGASGVVASLWKVDDSATAALMKAFYANMLQRGMGPAAALRAAQNEIRSQPKWSAPYYWAGFTFQGDYDLTIRSQPPASRFGYACGLLAGVALVGLLAAYWFRRVRRSS
jgi:CHAT domain-containing protein/predicted negative regulator of RcsB-dependent stress response